MGPLTWLGWPGKAPPSIKAAVAKRLREEYGCVPVFMHERLVKGFYNGFCNGTLWPLFHSMPSRAQYHAEQWKAYREANELFARRLDEEAGPGDDFWIQDFHLMLVPALLRKLRPQAKIGLFLHIPFPSYDTLRALPWHRDILEGMAGADLVGFHTYDYAQAYLGSLRRLLGLDNALGEVLTHGRAFQVDVFPMGIDFDGIQGTAASPEAVAEAGRVRAGAADRRISLSISRLDYTKGIHELLDGMETFLETRPQWHQRFHHYLVVTPSREGVGQYALLKREVDERVGRLNGRFGAVNWTPLRYIFRRLRLEELAGLYLASDVAVITPSRDGMNLMAKEYLAAKSDEAGVLVLSEFAGAARELTEALLVNPNNREDVAAALTAALEMPPSERRRRSALMRQRLAANDVHRWARRFLDRLDKAAERSRQFAAARLSEENAGELVEAFAVAERGLVILDYDGTLVPFARDPAAAVPDAELVQVLRAIAERPGMRVVLISGRDKDTLDRWFSALPVALVAEHGAWYRPGGGLPWQRSVHVDGRWKGQVREVLDLFVERIPGSFIEEKDSAVVWHWRSADPTIGADAARELIEAMTAMTANTDLIVLPGSRIVEVKVAAAGKGPFFTNFLASEASGFVLALGDDITDESLFRALPRSAYSVRVGAAASAARFNVLDVGAARDLLARLAQVGPRTREHGIRAA